MSEYARPSEFIRHHRVILRVDPLHDGVARQRRDTAIGNIHGIAGRSGYAVIEMVASDGGDGGPALDVMSRLGPIERTVPHSQTGVGASIDGVSIACARPAGDAVADKARAFDQDVHARIRRRQDTVLVVDEAAVGDGQISISSKGCTPGSQRFGSVVP